MSNKIPPPTPPTYPPPPPPIPQVDPTNPPTNTPMDPLIAPKINPITSILSNHLDPRDLYRNIVAFLCSKSVKAFGSNGWPNIN